LRVGHDLDAERSTLARSRDRIFDEPPPAAAAPPRGLDEEPVELARIRALFVLVSQ